MEADTVWRVDVAGYTVAELCQTVGATVRDAFPDEVWVRGVISGLSRSNNGHVYFDLIEPNDLGTTPDAAVPVALFASARQRVNGILRKTNAARMEDGTEIRIRGRVEYYSRQGRVQLIMSLIDPAYTLGQLEAAKAQLLAELAKEGALEANRSLPFPAVPLRVGLITSSGSAAEADFVDELAKSRYPFETHLFDSRVQGDVAVAELVRALAEAGAHRSIDVIAIVRGGGARTDLSAFDHGQVARAIAASPRPVIVGIGHEVDSSVADHVASRSAKTPTACAALLIDAVATFESRIDRATTRLGQVAAATITRQAAKLDMADSQLADKARRVLERADHKLATAAITVKAHDPRLALARGWSITHTADGRLVTDVSQLEEGAELVTTLAAGTVASTVTELREPSDREPSDMADNGR